MRRPMPSSHAEVKRIVPSASAWRSRGALHVITASTVIMILLLSVLQAIADHALVLQQTKLLTGTVANLAVQQTQQVLTRADAAIIELASHRRQGGDVTHSAPADALEGISSIHVLPRGSQHHLDASAQEAGVLEELVNVDGIAVRAVVALDTDWLKRQLVRLTDESRLTVVLMDQSGSLMIQTGSHPILTTGNQVMRDCLCTQVHFP